jgi:rare lipoprotein A
MKALVVLVLLASPAMAQEGLASKYGNENHQYRTATGEAYRPWAEVTCAHRTARLGSWLRVVDRRTKKSIVCRVSDRGPFISGRIIDLSLLAAARLGMRGIDPVEVSGVGR